MSDLLAAARLPVEVGVGVVVYLAGAAVIFRAAATELVAMVRTAVFRRGSAR